MRVSANTQEPLWSGPRRFRTREITVGNLRLGGDIPLVIQSMTTTDTMNIEATVQQVKDLVHAGCPLVRITAPTVQDAEALKAIREKLFADGYKVPLVADIHFVPAAALVAADYVEKVRINPGNYADRKMFKTRDYSDSEYAEELDRIHEKFKPLVSKLKSLGRALRIGTNHGSLSDRIMNRYGDTPEGMIESAFEFAEICRLYDFHNFCFSMKASNVAVMVKAYRLLVERQLQKGWDYPIHLGVTEAGDGEDGRMKSAIGIGTLLSEGLGDTLRVSLTESPVKEVPVAQAIADYFPKTRIPVSAPSKNWNFEAAKEIPLVWQSLDAKEKAVEKFESTKLRPDVLFIKDESILKEDALNFKAQLRSTLGVKDLKLALRFNTAWTAEERKTLSEVVDIVVVDSYDLRPSEFSSVVLVSNLDEWRALSAIEPSRTVFYWKDFREEGELKNLIALSYEAGAAFVDACLSGIWLDGLKISENLNWGFGILQSTRRRMSKTEYISCPSCGRTLFDLEETTARIKTVTNHLVGVKIAVMGCIVNGPGEMADADFGYVGGAPGRVNLYVGKECVQRNIPSEEAPQALVGLIKKHDRWVEPVL